MNKMRKKPDSRRRPALLDKVLMTTIAIFGVLALLLMLGLPESSLRVALVYGGF